MNTSLQRAKHLQDLLGLGMPVLMAPMAGVPSLALAQAVARAGALPGLGALLMDAAEISDWVERFRSATAAKPDAQPLRLQINLWVPDPPAQRDADHEAAVRAFVGQHGPAVDSAAGDAAIRDFDAQFAAVLAARPLLVSSIMGLFKPQQVEALKRAGIRWMATVTTVAEALAAQAAGADLIVAQGSEAGGHRGAFDAASARDATVGLFALLPQVVDAVQLPVVAAGGIGDARGVAAALMLGASGVQLGTALLRSPEAGIAPAWVDGLKALRPEDTRLTRAFSGRWARALHTDYVRAAAASTAPAPAPYPVQRGITAAMRKAAEAAGDLQHMQAWAGQGAGLVGEARPAAEWLLTLWEQARSQFGGINKPQAQG